MKTLTKWFSLSIVFLLLLTACSKNEATEGHSANVDHSTMHGNQSDQSAEGTDLSNLNWTIPDFSYTNQDGKTFSSNQLKGKVYLLDLIFTRCPDICPPMTANMAKIQQEAKKQGVDLHFVSMTVDPQYDQPAVLKTFADLVKADYSTWNFLTGYDQATIEKFAKDVLKQEVRQVSGTKPDEPVFFQHPSSFYLVDGTGKIRMMYDGLNPNPAKIVEAAKELQQEGN